MEKQITFDDLRFESERPLPTRGDVDTSKASAKAIEKTKHRSKHREAIYRLIKARAETGATCDEVEESLQIRHQTASCFIRFLTQDGLLYGTTERRLTRAGRKAIVWMAI